MNTATRMVAFIAGMLILSLGGAANAKTAPADGDSVISAVDRHEQGYRNLRSSVTMTLQNAQGRKRERHLEVYSVELLPLGDRRKFVFSRPADLDGTAVLIHSKVVENDDQWIFLPAFKRVKRIASSNRSTPFVGSEFSYEDLASQEMEKYSNRLVDSTILDGQLCDVVERVPRFPHSAYSKLVAYVDRESHRYRKVEYFDQAGKHIKTQRLDEYRLYDQRYWLPNRTVMINHKTDKTTTMLWGDIRLKIDLSETQLTATALKRAR